MPAGSIVWQPTSVGLRFIVFAGLAFAACGGGGSGSPSTPASPAGNATATFMGTARSTGPTDCAADSHQISAGSGTVTVTLVETSPRVALIVQLCPPTAVDHSRDCTINRQRIEVGQTLSGPRQGGAGQTLVFNTLNCGGGGAPEPAPIAYTASVMYPR